MDQLLDPAAIQLVALGLPQGETREWTPEMILDSNGDLISVLCLNNFFSQQAFPAAGPTRGGGMFCLANLVAVGPFESEAHGIYLTVIDDNLPVNLPSRLNIETVDLGDCGILRQNTTSTTDTELWHTITCATSSGQTFLTGSFVNNGPIAAKNAFTVPGIGKLVLACGSLGGRGCR